MAHGTRALFGPGDDVAIALPPARPGCYQRETPRNARTVAEPDSAVSVSASVRQMRPVYQTDVHNASSALRGLWLDKLGADLSPRTD
jgi:hypothetical protein